uniref:Pepsin inhibitor-3-like repeated domain-containing protein n=1 Tax=Parascaris univalens TaxID=6257 RepID=A0A915C5K6_PARUN
MLLLTLILVFLASTNDAFSFFSSSSYSLEIVSSNTTCIVENGKLVVNGETRANLTEPQLQELKEYERKINEWSKWSITKTLESFAEMFARIFGSDGLLWNGFGLWGGTENGNASTPLSSTTAAPNEPNKFPDPPSFCQV